MSKILVSYRREDSVDVTGWIYDRLIHQFGRAGGFKDVDSIPLGVDFRTYLEAHVAKCNVFLSVIGRDWMKKRGSKGKFRLDDPGDFVRIEIESALKRQIPGRDVHILINRRTKWQSERCSSVLTGIRSPDLIFAGVLTTSRISSRRSPRTMDSQSKT